MLKLKGSITALVTPFLKNGAIDYDLFAKQIEFQIKQGSSGIVPCGTTGESPTLTHDEHHEVIRFAVNVVKKRVSVIAGTGSNSTQEAIELTRQAKKAGADASLSVAPYYNKPTQDGLYAHFSQIAKKGGLPIVLYNIPGRCNVEISINTIEKLAKIKEIIAVKEATGMPDRTSQIINRTNLTVLSGDDALTLPLMSLGAKGVISVVSNIFPKENAKLVTHCLNGNYDQARKDYYKLFDLIQKLFIETNPAPVKSAMKFMKMDSGILRLPLTHLKASNEKILLQALRKYQSATRKRR